MKIKKTIEIARHVLVQSSQDLHNACVAASKAHPWHYILAYADFGEATLFRAERLPTNAYASDDWKAGYWKDGVHHEWSAARVASAQRAVDRLTGLQ